MLPLYEAVSWSQRRVPEYNRAYAPTIQLDDRAAEVGGKSSFSLCWRPCGQVGMDALAHVDLFGAPLAVHSLIDDLLQALEESNVFGVLGPGGDSLCQYQIFDRRNEDSRTAELYGDAARPKIVESDFDTVYCAPSR